MYPPVWKFFKQSYCTYINFKQVLLPTYLSQTAIVVPKKMPLKYLVNGTYFCHTTRSSFTKKKGKQENKTPKGIMRSAVPLPCFFDAVESHRVAGQRPRQGTKSCRMGRNSVRLSARPSIRPSIRPPLASPQTLLADPQTLLAGPQTLRAC